MNFEDAFARLITVEAGYVNHPDDPGGATRWGVTERVARAYGYTGDMFDYPLEEAKKVYKASYWNMPRVDDLPEPIRYDVFDAAVNSGITQATKWLQAACTVTIDGKIGPETVTAAHAMDPQELKRRFTGYRLLFMTDLPTWASFGRGWAKRIGKNLLA